MRTTEGGGAPGTIVIDIAGVRRASGLVADDAHAFQQIGARVAGHALPSLPPEIAGRVAADLADAASALRLQPQLLVDVAQEYRVRAFWAEIVDKLAMGVDLSDAQLTEFKAAYASGLLTRYAEPWQADLAKAYAKKVHDDENPGGLKGFFNDVGDFFEGAWDAIKDPAVMLYHLTPFSDDWEDAWGDLGHGLAYGVTHPVEFGKAIVNLDALEERGLAYWLGNLAPAAAATLLSGGAAAGVRGAEGAAALERTAAGVSRLEKVVSASSKPAWLKRLEDGNAFNRERYPLYEHKELYVDKPEGKGYYRVDSYDTVKEEIVSRKYTQLGNVTEETALKYVRELDAKYSPGTKIADVPSTPDWLRGEHLTGKPILEVPVQHAPIPDSVLEEATRLDIQIRDVNGHVYNSPGVHAGTR